MSSTPNPPEMPASMVMMQMLTSRWVEEPLHLVVQLGIPDHLKNGPKTIEELATATQTHAPSLYRVMRALASLGVFSEGEDGKFALTPLGSTLQSQELGGVAMMLSQEWHWQPWKHLLESVKTGKTAFEIVYGMNVFEYLQQHHQASKIFDNAMTSFTATHGSAVVNAYNFSNIHKMADIAGGNGRLLATILNANPQMEGILFDLPQVIAGAVPVLESIGVAEQCKLISGSFFESIPAGCDAYMMKSIIHDWDDEKALLILQNCRKAMIGKHGKLLLIEMVIPVGDTPSVGKLLDLEMLVMAGGRERTESEYQNLLKEAGFELTQIIPTEAPFSIIEAVPV